MEYPEPLLEGRFERRYKRFIADVTGPAGELFHAHCPNTGSMRGCLEPGARAWISRARNPARKLPYTLEILEAFGALVCVNTQRPNAVAEEAIRAGVIPELAGCSEVRREVRYDGGRSRVDLLLERAGERCYVEVKSATMGVGGGVTRFPDAVTDRGTKHLRALMNVVAAGDRAVLLFCAGRDDTRRVEPADDIDPIYGKTLRAAAAAGVELMAWRCDVSSRGVWMRERVPVVL